MAIIQILRKPLYPYLEAHITHLRKNRKSISNSDKTNRVGINFSLIITSACLIEGVLEAMIKRLLERRTKIIRENEIDDFYHRRITNMFLNNVEKFIEKKVTRTTGVENFLEYFELLSYRIDPIKLDQFKNWEGIRALFQLRNVLAHGREISAEMINAWYFGEEWKEYFSGGYKMAEDYLSKKKIIKKGFIKNKSIDHLLSNKVADHFCVISTKFLYFSKKILRDETKKFTMESIRGI